MAAPPNTTNGSSSRNLISGAMYPNSHNSRLSALEQKTYAVSPTRRNELALTPAESWDGVAPAFGLHSVGDRVHNNTPTAGGVADWLCVVEGAPGTWAATPVLGLDGAITDTQHGNRSGGSLHAQATTLIDGFLSASDKSKLDSLAVGGYVGGGGANGQVAVWSSTTSISGVSAISDTQHGSRGNGSLHSAVTSLANGFMIASDKAKLDLLTLPLATTISGGGTIALGGYSITAPGSGTLVISTDSRLSDARVPTAHATTHHSGGSDALALGSIAGTINAAQHGSLSGGSLHSAVTSLANGFAIAADKSKLDLLTLPAATTISGGGTLALAGFTLTAPGTGTIVIGTDSRLSDARTPTAHVATHHSGGSDPINLAAVAGTITATQHGSLAGGTLHSAVSGGTNGFMIATDKVKLDLLTMANAVTITGGGAITLNGFTATVPATGTVAMRDVANTFTGANAFNAAITGTGTINLTGTGSSSMAGNLGVGKALPQSWATGYSTVEISTGGNFLAGAASTGNELALTKNAYWDGTNWLKFGSGYASMYQQNAGAHTFRGSTNTGAAGTTITWTDMLSLSFGAKTITIADAFDIVLNTNLGTRIGTGATQKVAFLGATPIGRPAAYTLTGSATRVFPTDPSAAYTGLASGVAATPYASVNDLNTLRGVVSTLLGAVRQMATDLGSVSGYGLLNA